LNDARSYTLKLTATDNAGASASLDISLTVHPPPPAIADFTPKNGRVGTVVTLTGRSLKAGVINPVVSFKGAGEKEIQAGVVSANETEVKVNAPNGAVTGPIRLRNDYGGPAQTAPFTVDPSKDFKLAVGPTSAIAAQGSSATYIVSITAAPTSRKSPTRSTVNGSMNTMDGEDSQSSPTR
jgi:hypothetical protein